MDGDEILRDVHTEHSEPPLSYFQRFSGISRQKVRVRHFALMSWDFLPRVERTGLPSLHHSSVKFPHVLLLHLLAALLTQQRHGKGGLRHFVADRSPVPRPTGNSLVSLNQFN